MKISESTYKKLNELVKYSFELNAFADNCAYNIDYMQYPNIGDIYHHSFAHVFPQLADIITELMIKLNARPVRLGLSDFITEYGDLVVLFEDNNKKVEDYRKAIKETINIAEMNEDDEVKIALEEFLIKFLPYVKQSDIWLNKAQQYKERPQQFDIHFEELTTFIPIIK